MTEKKRDRELGMSRRITRRDFLNGVAVAVGTGFLPIAARAQNPNGEFAPEKAADYYPPALTGLRGSHEGSYEPAHELRDGTFWTKSRPVTDTAERYDLVIVGGGISGLSAAHFYRKHAGASARILILDNHDDFGGHAKRNEFRAPGRTLLGYGGTFSIDSPAPYSNTAKSLIAELGIKVESWPKVVDFGVYSSRKLQPAVFFDRETFGTDRLLPFPLDEFQMEEDSESAENDRVEIWKRFLLEAPIAEEARRDIYRLSSEEISDCMPDLTSEEKKSRLARISYAEFLTNHLKLHPDVVRFFQSRIHGLYGVGIDAIPAQDAWGLGLPGFEQMNLKPTPGIGMNLDAIRHPEGGEAYFYHFPDGGATIARLLVRRLIPAAIPGHSADDIVTARCRYSKLDEPESPVRIRLNSTVTRTRHVSGKEHVEITYLRRGNLHSVLADRCILACWNGVIPYICPELPASQKEDLAYGTKVPLLYTNVAISNWKSFMTAGVYSVHCPGSYHSLVSLDMPVSVGAYNCPRNPEEPIVIHMMRTPCSPGLPARDQHRAGRLELLSTDFATIELNIREQLNRMFGPSGFNAAKDIQGITVNRWAHGYAYQYNSLFDSFWLEGKETPCERARKPFGRIAVANADAAAYSYIDAAIDQAYRAVNEVMK